jgi:translation initiation factor IF-3
VRVIDNNGEQMGIMSIADALDLAVQRELDLVEVSGNADPPVCRVLDYGKLRYLHSKKIKESRKAQKSTDLREVRFRPNIGVHDLDAKTRKIAQLLAEGAKVRVAVFFRGREVTHPELGMALLKKITDEVKDNARLERSPSMERNNVSITLVPATAKSDKKPVEVKNAEA